MKMHELTKMPPEGMFSAPHAQIILGVLSKGPLDTQTLTEKVVAKIGDGTRAKNPGQAVSNYLVDFRKGGFVRSYSPDAAPKKAAAPKKTAAKKVVAKKEAAKKVVAKKAAGSK